MRSIWQMTETIIDNQMMDEHEMIGDEESYLQYSKVFENY
jgi:hypothetical protein